MSNDLRQDADSGQTEELGLTKLRRYCESTRDVLKKRARKKLVARNKEVHALLEQLSTRPELAQQFEDLKGDYGRLARLARTIENNQLMQGISAKQQRKLTEAISLELRSLKLKLRLAMDAVDPIASDKFSKVILAAERHRPLYEDERKRIERAVAELSGLPGTGEQVDELKKMLDHASRAEPEYQKAHRQLANADRLIEQGKRAATQFQSTVGGETFQQKLVQARDAIVAYENLAGIADADFPAAQNKRIDEAIRDIDRVSENEQLVASATDDGIETLDSVIATCTAKVSELEDLKERVRELQRDVARVMDKVTLMAPTSVTGPLTIRTHSAMALASTQQWESARDALTILLTDARRMREQYRQDYEAWLELDEELKETHEPILNDARQIRLLEVAANAAISIIQRVVRSELIPAKAFGDACKKIRDDVLNDINVFKSAVESPEVLSTPQFKFADDKRNVEFRLEQAKAAIQEAESECRAKIKQLEQEGGDIRRFTKGMQDVWTQWSAYRKSVLTLDSTDDMLDRLDTTCSGQQRTCIDAFDQIKTTVESILGDEERLEESKRSQAIVLLLAGFDETKANVNRLISYLKEFGLPDDHPILTRSPSLASIEHDIAGLDPDNEASMTTLEEFKEEVEARNALAEDEIADLHRRSRAVAAEITQTLSQSEGANKDFAAYFDKLDGRLGDTLATATSTVIAVALVGFESLKQLKDEIQQFASELASDDEDANSFKRVKAKIDDLKQRLKANDVKEYQKVDQAVLMKRLETQLPDQLHQQSPTDALQTLAEFERQVVDTENAAALAKADREQLLEEVAAAKREFKDLKKKDAPELYESLQTRIKMAEKSPKGEEKQALVEIATIRMLIADATDEEKRDAMQARVKRELFEAKRDHEAFLGELDVFNNNSKRKADAAREATPKKQRNKDLYEQMQKAFKDAKDTGDKGNYVVARAQLQQAIALADYFAANPFNQSTTARKELVKLNNEWKQAVGNYLKVLNELKKTITTEGAEDDDVDTAQAIAALEPLSGLFDCNLFDATVELLSVEMTDASELTKRRSKKENSLFHLRRFERNLDSDAILEYAIGNPINNLSVVGLRTALSAMRGALLAA